MWSWELLTTPLQIFATKAIADRPVLANATSGSNGDNWWFAEGRLSSAALDKQPVTFILCPMMDAVEELVIEVRDHYVAQFRVFIRQQQAACKIGGPEVKFELSAETTAFYQMAVVDFVRNDGAPEGVLFEPENMLTFEKIEGFVADTKLVIDGLRWDSVVVNHDAPQIRVAIEAWFHKWFDPYELRMDPAAELSDCIHAVYVEPNELQVDLGTAPASAFWELLDSISHGGATFLHVRS